ncbi:MAG: bifunctional 4-hydroxy-2-oxoglutarate aldolase/2-dehydro-3-deoxy-phosphogluconate aldolase [Acidobacteria bacterium]|jgi:2-dehydro-3-deoxyphosphogluconate aldolase/(4S)-4-hydroxy-2-oxoglutarate aldolase|nr:bifunctional 4-hydroxy-2-oxoglutarate aldolase/2-dehydro-3-deoxy-phosphogluconate aldolase [Acidobacteriota bacterium]
MSKTEVIEKIREVGIIPVVRAGSHEEAQTVIKALIAGGINVLEVTMTIPNAVELIARLTGEYRNATVIGAGTVLDRQSAEKCIEAGAKFIVSPILDLETVSFCNENEIAVLAGALTPTEIFTAWKAGADLVKVFPVSAMGGVSYLKAIKTVFPQIEFVPTGGINLENAVDYIKSGAFAVGIGGELTKGQESIISEKARNIRNIIKLK